MPYMTYSQLKNSAKRRMAPVMGRLIGVTAIQFGLSIVISQAVSFPALLPMPFLLRTIIYILSTVLCYTLTGMLDAGVTFIYLKLYCGRPFSVSDVFYAFTGRTKTCLGLSFVLALVTAIPFLPVSVLSLRLNTITEQMSLDILSSADAAGFTAMPEFLNTLTILFFCLTPALIITTVLNLIYSQAYYLMLDFPACSVRELLRKSRLLMRGHKGRFFYIQVCFLPLMLLGSFTCGILLLWIIPLICAVQTEFYLDLVTKRRVQG